MTHFKDYVDGFVNLQAAGRACPLGQAPFPPPPPKGGPRVVLFSPHPDDECIYGGLPVRLIREAGCEVINVAVTQGSRKDRQAGRLVELKNACRYIGFDLVTTKENGLEGINRKTRDGNPAAWGESVLVAESIIRRFSPSVIFIPHERDANSTHEGVNLLVMDALRKIGDSFRCRMVETEFWAPMEKPNLMVEVSAHDLTDLLEALSFHVGEVSRNPYHLTLPAWMIDNVRRGGEIVGGQGGAAPDFPFATLYRIMAWNGRALEPLLKQNKVLTAQESAGVLLG
jgi:LmbE family N-acetylglucosaminyl deacetylase